MLLLLGYLMSSLSAHRDLLVLREYASFTQNMEVFHDLQFRKWLNRFVRNSGLEVETRGIRGILNLLVVVE
jgi:hypothetical protein